VDGGSPRDGARGQNGGVLRGFTIHVVTFAVINALIIGVYYAITGSPIPMADVQSDPIQAVRDGFWPLWVIAGWGAALLIHMGVVLATLAFGSSHRRRKRQAARRHGHGMGTGGRYSLEGQTPPRALPGGIPVPEFDHGTLARDATKAAIGLVESLGARLQPGQKRDAKAAATPRPTGRHWVVAMFTDIAGSTDLTETLGDEAWSRVLSEHRSVVRSCVEAHGGQEVGTQGDGFLVRFDHAIDAVACAVSIQRHFDDMRRAGSFVPEVKIGIHAGEAVAAEDDDLVGRVINLASRVTTVAEPSEILVTEPVADRLGPNVMLVDRGLQELRGVPQPRHLLGVVWQATAEPAPPEVTETHAEPEPADG
jgi:class 3 adenylate cyclase